MLSYFQLLNGGIKDGGVMKPSPMSVQPAVPNAPTENDLIASKLWPFWLTLQFLCTLEYLQV